jgi:hypothetical protein
MRVSEMMSVHLVTCAPTDSVGDASRRMTAANVGAALVCEHERLVGLLTERDVLRLVAARLALDRSSGGSQWCGWVWCRLGGGVAGVLGWMYVLTNYLSGEVCMLML